MKKTIEANDGDRLTDIEILAAQDFRFNPQTKAVLGGLMHLLQTHWEYGIKTVDLHMTMYLAEGEMIEKFGRPCFGLSYRIIDGKPHSELLEQILTDHDVVMKDFEDRALLAEFIHSAGSAVYWTGPLEDNPYEMEVSEAARDALLKSYERIVTAKPHRLFPIKSWKEQRGDGPEQEKNKYKDKIFFGPNAARMADGERIPYGIIMADAIAGQPDETAMVKHMLEAFDGVSQNYLLG